MTDENMRKINVWGGVHGDEWQSQALVHELRRSRRHNPSVPVLARTAHSRGHGWGREGSRNLAFAFPGNQAPMAGYEERRAAQIVRQSRDAYATIDAHQVMDHGIRTAYIDCQRGVSPAILGFLQALGMCSLIGTHGWGMQGHIPNAFLLETTYNPGDERRNIIQALHRLACDPDHPTAQAGDFEWFTYAEAMHTDVCRPPSDLDSFMSLVQLPHKLPDAIATAIGLQGLPAYLLNWRETPLQSGAWGEIGIRIPVPDTAAWPYK